MNTIELDWILKRNISSKYQVGVYPSDYINQVNSQEFAVVFNRDSSDNIGSHWVACFKNMYENFEFFDSMGFSVFYYPFVVDLAKRYGNTVTQSTSQIQENWTNHCGLYSLHYLINRSKGVSFVEYINKFDFNDLKENSKKILNFTYP